MKRFLRTAFATTALVALAACGGEDEAEVDPGTELAPPPVETVPPATDTMMVDTMMIDTLADTLTTTHD